MSRTVTITREVYTYNELSDAAKEAVRQWWGRGAWEDGHAQESCEGIWTNLLECEGWTNYDSLSFGDLYSQGGDMITWVGEFNFTHDDGVVFHVTVGTRHVGGGSRAFTVELQNVDNAPDHEYLDSELAYENQVERAVRDHLCKLQQELFRDFRAEDEYISSDESVSDLCEANGYEFTEDGVLA